MFDNLDMKKLYVKNKLYIEFRVEFEPNTNQDLLHELADQMRDSIHDHFDQDDPQIPVAKDVTYEVIMEIGGPAPEVSSYDETNLSEWATNPSQES